VDFWEDGPLVEHLRQTIPKDLSQYVLIRPAHQAPTDSQGTILYPLDTGAIQLRPGTAPGDYFVWFWHPQADASALTPYELWFWREAYRFAETWPPGPHDKSSRSSLPHLEAERSQLKGGFDRSGMATVLVLFGLFFVCVYLVPSVTCEEHERGVLLAQALSPATPWEILAAKFLFYPLIAITLAVLLVGFHQPAVLIRPFFWAALTVTVAGFMGIGLTLASLARTQRAASTSAMGYLLAVALLLFLCQQTNVSFVPYLAVEYHGPRMLHAALTDTVQWYHWGSLAATGVLAVGWTVVAVLLFQRRGWQ
jgi:hypothetical protein